MRPLAGLELFVRVTLPEKPASGVTETSNMPLPFLLMLRLLGVAATVKLGPCGVPLTGGAGDSSALSFSRAINVSSFGIDGSGGHG